MTEPSILACDGVHKHFEEAGQRLEVLRGVELQVRAGETLAIIGASGSGKTTLLQILGGLDLPTRGTVRLTGLAFAELSDAARGDLRNRALGFVYQFHHLLPEFSALENVAMPLLVRRTSVADARRDAQWFLERVGLGQRLTHRPSQLSGGERQRAAVAVGREQFLAVQQLAARHAVGVDPEGLDEAHLGVRGEKGFGFGDRGEGHLRSPGRRMWRAVR